MASNDTRYSVQELVNSHKLEIGDGHRAKNSELSDCGIPFARAGNINNGFRFEDCDYFPIASISRIGRKISSVGDVVFTSKGTVGRFAFVEDSTPRFVYSPQLCFWRSLDQNFLDSRFLYYWMQSKEFVSQANSVKGQTDMADYVSLTDQKKMVIRLPSIAEQVNIAAVLTCLDQRITTNTEMNRALEQLASALFKSWFIDFDPVIAKSEGRRPFGMSDDVAALFPDRFEESELGPIPEGWRVSQISELAAINELTLGAKDDLETIQYIEISEVSRGEIGNISTYKRGSEPSRARRRTRHGDTVLSTVRPDRGSYYLAIEPSENIVVSTGFAVLSPTTVPWSWLHMALTRRELLDTLGILAEGSAYPAISPDAIGKLQFAIPVEASVLQAFHSIGQVLLLKAAANRKSNACLKLLRDTLLPPLISGELCLKQAEQRVEAVL